MFTTGCALIILTACFVIFDLKYIMVPVVFQIFAANIVINLGLFVISKFESRYVIVEYLLDISYIIAVLVVFGAVFNWYPTIPVWILAVMAVVIYIFSIIISMNKLRKDTKKINELLQKRREKNAGAAS
jgi:membrane protein implicated in regulation of membrane protease activity